MTIENFCKSRFRDENLYAFYLYEDPHKDIPSDIARVLSRKLDMLYSAVSLEDLKSPPGNRLEKLEPKHNNKYSIRVNNKYRLIFTYKNNQISDIYLDKHSYNL